MAERDRRTSAGLDHDETQVDKMSKSASPAEGSSTRTVLPVHHTPASTKTSFQPSDLRQEHCENHNRAYENCVAHNIKGLYSSFHTAVTILRIARELGELDESLADEPDGVTTFFNRLKLVEQHLRDKPSSAPFVVLVEGLDGSGKTTLVQRLANTPPPSPLSHVHFIGKATSTPTPSMTSVRNVFDHRGGAVARAFYMVSNYILQHEIREECQRHPHTIFVVDRWFASTCAYSVAWKNTIGGPESIDALDASLFQWPNELMLPNMLLLLQVDDTTRRHRVQARNSQDGNSDTIQHNPWDDRLNQDEYLGRRIFRAFERLQGPKEFVHVDANQTPDQVFQDAVALVHDRAKCHFFPWVYFQRQPLEFFRWTCSQLGFCDGETGRRCQDAPLSWSLQLAVNSPWLGSPLVRTIDIDTVDNSGILFFTSRNETVGASRDQDFQHHRASMAWVGGEFTQVHHWRAEGILCSATLEECLLMNQSPRSYMVAQFASYQNGLHEVKKSNSCCTTVELATSCQDGMIQKTPFTTEAAKFVAATRFVPLRIEVLMNEPGSAKGKKRSEWRRDTQFGEDGWSGACDIPQFHLPKPVPDPATPDRLLPLTVVLTGTHCSGKATLGKRLANVLGFTFHGELGELLRSSNLTEGGHRLGDGSGSKNASRWDELVHKSEVSRDQESEASRVVETWHMGNLAWALFRIDAPHEPTSNALTREELVRWTRSGIQQEMRKSIVIWVHLSVSLSTMLRRRNEYPDCSTRLPLANEYDDCQEMHRLLEERNVRHELKDIKGIPRLVLDNNQDGDEAMKERIREVLAFIHCHQWRRGLPT